ncbi:hypothetical protein [Agrobacterium rubi]|uniref:hypothetical protein n=1 Tax=Agrobacterium rubi TaxID=28099 RepID=UPI0015747A1F|nr:hypothetical protein [Agrobacterium rubi]
MGTVNRAIQNDYDRDMASKLVANRPYPFTLTITDGSHRSNAQNRLQHMWMKEISEQKGDITPEEARAYCKLTIGIPILRQNEAFRIRYDEILKPLSYEHKMAIMSEPINLPVTSLMSTKQLSEYLEGIIRHFGEQGIVLTMPDDMREQTNSNPADHSPDDQPGSGDTPPSPETDEAGDSPSTLASSPLSEAKLRQHLMDFARKAFSTAADKHLTAKQKVGFINDMRANIKRELPEATWGKFNTIRFSAERSIKAPETISTERAKVAKDLDCQPSEIGGVNG